MIAGDYILLKINNSKERPLAVAVVRSVSETSGVCSVLNTVIGIEGACVLEGKVITRSEAETYIFDQHW